MAMAPNPHGSAGGAQVPTEAHLCSPEGKHGWSTVHSPVLCPWKLPWDPGQPPHLLILDWTPRCSKNKSLHLTPVSGRPDPPSVSLSSPSPGEVSEPSWPLYPRSPASQVEAMAGPRLSADLFSSPHVGVSAQTAAQDADLPQGGLGPQDVAAGATSGMFLSAGRLATLCSFTGVRARGNSGGPRGPGRWHRRLGSGAGRVRRPRLPRTGLSSAPRVVCGQKELVSITSPGC